MTQARSEITLKFNELPQVKPTENKKVEITLADQNGVTFTALVNAKSWRKAEADAANFNEWGGAVSGKLGQRTADGFEVVEAGVRIFEKKPKSAVTEAVATN